MLIGGPFLATNPLPSYTRYLSTASQNATHHNVSSLLKEINNHSLNLHKNVGESLSQLLQYVLIFQGGSLSLWRPSNGGWSHIERLDITNQKYHDYKSLAHIPWHIKIILENGDYDKANKLLSDLHQLWLLCKQSADYSSYSQYIEDCISVLKYWCLHPEKAQEIWSIYKNKYDPIIATLMRLATDEVLSTLDKTTRKWLGQHNIDLKRAKIIIASTHGPRSRLAEAQYMQALVKSSLQIEDDKGIENVYIYQTEVLPSQLADGEQLERDLIQELLVPSQVNSMIGSKMMNDPLGMYQDILHREAQDWLDTKSNQGVGSPSSAVYRNITKHQHENDSSRQGDISRCPMHATLRG